jgi:hypothetical protein
MAAGGMPRRAYSPGRDVTIGENAGRGTEIMVHIVLAVQKMRND